MPRQPFPLIYDPEVQEHLEAIELKYPSLIAETIREPLQWREGREAMKITSVADMKARLGASLKESENGPVIVTRNGRPAAVLLGMQDEDEIERLALAHSPRVPGHYRSG